MNKPKRSDFPTGRTGSSAYTTAMNKWRASNKKVKPKSNDPRPQWSSKKYKNYNEFNKAVLAWKKRNEKPKPKRLSPYERKHGRKSNTVKSKEANESINEYVKKNKGDKPIRKVDYPSKSENTTKNVSVKENKENKQNNEKKVVTKKNDKLKINSTTKGGPVASGVEYAKSKGDDLAGYRRTKDTRITKKLKKAGFTEDRLARLRKKHAEWKAKRKKKKK